MRSGFETFEDDIEIELASVEIKTASDACQWITSEESWQSPNEGDETVQIFVYECGRERIESGQSGQGLYQIPQFDNQTSDEDHWNGNINVPSTLGGKAYATTLCPELDAEIRARKRGYRSVANAGYIGAMINLWKPGTAVLCIPFKIFSLIMAAYITVISCIAVAFVISGIGALGSDANDIECYTVGWLGVWYGVLGIFTMMLTSASTLLGSRYDNANFQGWIMCFECSRGCFHTLLFLLLVALSSIVYHLSYTRAAEDACGNLDENTVGVLNTITGAVSVGNITFVEKSSAQWQETNLNLVTCHVAQIQIFTSIFADVCHP